MTNTINDYKLDSIAKDYAQEILKQTQDMDEASDLAWQYSDGSEWVIYHYKSHQLCLHCNTDNGEEFLEEVGAGESPTYNSLASIIAFGELLHRIQDAIQGELNNA